MFKKKNLYNGSKIWYIKDEKYGKARIEQEEVKLRKENK